MGIIDIESLEGNDDVHVYASLTESQLRNRLNPDNALFIAESPKVIKVALQAGYDPVSILCERKHIEGDAAEVIAMAGDIDVFTGSRELLQSLGIDAVLLTPTSCDPLNRRAVRVSMGSVFLVPWTFIYDPISSLKRLGFVTAAMALNDDSVSLDEPALKKEPRLAIIMGTEGDGLSDKVISDADYTVRIPMAHGVDSLNVAAAAAVAFWELRLSAR